MRSWLREQMVTVEFAGFPGDREPPVLTLSTFRSIVRGSLIISLKIMIKAKLLWRSKGSEVPCFGRFVYFLEH
jgi:hypothetical protein